MALRGLASPMYILIFLGGTNAFISFNAAQGQDSHITGGSLFLPQIHSPSNVVSIPLVPTIHPLPQRIHEVCIKFRSPAPGPPPMNPRHETIRTICPPRYDQPSMAPPSGPRPRVKAESGGPDRNARASSITMMTSPQPPPPPGESRERAAPGDETDRVPPPWAGEREAVRLHMRRFYYESLREQAQRPIGFSVKQGACMGCPGPFWVRRLECRQ